jgi:8-oxo-dGTP pyrophosphatase MutT (NUDIX family)
MGPQKGMNNTKEVEPVIAAGGVVFRFIEAETEPEVLLIFRNGVWDLPKGKLEEGESIPMCAVREVGEEVGSSLPTIVRKIGTTYHEYTEKKKTMGKTTHWYAMIFTKSEELTPQEAEGIQEIKWISLSKAIEMAGFENLVDILKKFGPIKKA